jgi:hypothetical protein
MLGAGGKPREVEAVLLFGESFPPIAAPPKVDGFMRSTCDLIWTYLERLPREAT